MPTKSAVSLAKILKAASKGAFSTTGDVTIDTEAFAQAFALELAKQIRDNLRRGWRPDGSRPMPGRKLDGKPRGVGADIIETIAARPVGSRGTWRIAASEENRGHLRRILQRVPLRPNATSPAWAAALAAATKALTPR